MARRLRRSARSSPASAAAEVVLRDDVAVAFLDRSPLFHGHVLVVPREHVVTLPELAPTSGRSSSACSTIAAAVPVALGAQGTFVANNNVVSQSVAHLHVHVVPRTKGDGLRGFFWPRTRVRPRARRRRSPSGSATASPRCADAPSHASARASARSVADAT